jgi:hypothetical protein
MSVLQMDNCMDMYVFGVYSLKNNDVGRLFELILNGMLGLMLFWIGWQRLLKMVERKQVI